MTIQLRCQHFASASDFPLYGLASPTSIATIKALTGDRAFDHRGLVAAVRFNVLALVALGFLVVAYGTWTYGRVTNRQISGWQHHRWAPPMAQAVVAVWFVARNLPKAPLTALYV
ncbi:hypothetical protein [Mycolicibacterium sarraceniae]|uniref:hypothetical protein n=1 Tax=Mycolicibacterium sarraceniae TaxID=1534348 RepID=UPI0015D0F774|nr:hypothetical protein [Mycolicibacterium sarraceniae]